MVVVRIAPDIADEQDSRAVAEILPPVRGALLLRADLAGLVMDRRRAVAGVFDDLALGDVDQGKAIVVAVPRHDSTRLDHHLAEAQLATLDLRHLLAEVDCAERGVCYANGCEADCFASVRLAFVSGTFAGLRADRKAGGSDERDGSDRTKPAAVDFGSEHLDLLCFASARSSCAVV